MRRISRLEMSADESDHLSKMLREATILFINGLKYNKILQPLNK